MDAEIKEPVLRRRSDVLENIRRNRKLVLKLVTEYSRAKIEGREARAIALWGQLQRRAARLFLWWFQHQFGVSVEDIDEAK